MSHLRPVRQLSAAAIAGATTPLVLASQLVPVWAVATALAAGFIVLLPKLPWVVSAFCGGAALTMFAFWLAWSFSSSCASEVDGVIVEHPCAEPPPSRTGG